MENNSSPNAEREPVSLSKAATYLLEECRMVLPGMQALFGFQLIAVFSETFGKKMSHIESLLHLLALTMVAVAIALVMTPAAIHRRNGPMQVTRKFVESSTRLLLFSMFPLLIGICIDVYLISRMITESKNWSLMITGVVSAVFLFLWFIYPNIHAFGLKDDDQ